MLFESIKTILYTTTVTVLGYRLFFARIKDRRVIIFLLSSIVLTIFLILIIVFKFHHLLREECSLPNTVTYLISLIPFIYHFYKFKRIILNSYYLILLISIVFTALSLLIDLLTDGGIITFGLSDYIEELFVILGALFWLLYYIFYSLKLNEK